MRLLENSFTKGESIMTGTGRPLYFKGGVIEFFTKKDVKYYVVKVWNLKATNQGVIESKPLGEETPEQISQRVQQMLGTGGTE